MFLKVIVIAILTQPIFSQDFNCPQLKITNIADDDWNAVLLLSSHVDVTGLSNVEVTFDRVTQFVTNNIAQLSGTDNRAININMERQTLRANEILQIGFSGCKSMLEETFIMVPKIRKIKLNQDLMCSELDEDRPFNRSCVKIAMKLPSSSLGGRWDASLTVYPQQSANQINVDIQLDEPVFSLGNDLGNASTTDQKRFIIRIRDPIVKDSPLEIIFFTIYDPFRKIPAIDTVYIDGAATCIWGSTDPTPIIDRNSTFKKSSDKILLEHLPFDRFPQVKLISQVNNSNDCSVGGDSFLITSENEAESGQFPFHAAIFSGNDQHYMCGGSLISSKAVITAAHCVCHRGSVELLEKTNMRLLFGTVDLTTLTGNEALREVAELISHHEYKTKPILQQDIALIILKDRLQFSDVIKPICIHKAYQPISEYYDQKFFVVGFGSNNITDSPSPTLKYGKMSVITPYDCNLSKPQFGWLKDSAFCAKSFNNTTACTGDSGGGFFSLTGYKYYIRGLTSVSMRSSGEKCVIDRAVAFTDVGSFLPWIKETLETYEATD